jgi:hypothetical protein
VPEDKKFNDWIIGAERASQLEMLSVILEMRSSLKLIIEKQELLHNKIIAIDEESFPAGDRHGHKRYHELMIDKLESNKNLYRAIKEKGIVGILWSIVVAISGLVWHSIQTSLNAR